MARAGGIIPSSAFIDKFQPKIYIKPYVAAWSKYATKVLLEAGLYGVAQDTTITCPSNGAAALDGLYFLHYHHCFQPILITYHLIQKRKP